MWYREVYSNRLVPVALAAVNKETRDWFSWPRDPPAHLCQ